MPEGSVSAITTSITKLNEDHIQAQARRIELEAQLGEFAEARRRGRGLDAIPQVGGDEAAAEINGKIQVPHPRPRPAAREVQGGPPRGPEGPGPDAAAAQGPGRPGRADRGGPARGVPPAPAQGGGAAGRDRRPQGQGRRAEPEADRARVAQEEGGRRGRALRGPAAEAQRDQHRRLAPEQQHPPPRPRGGAGQPGVAPQAPDRPRGAPRRPAPRRGLGAAARRARQHAEGRRGRGAPPPPRAPRRHPPLRQGRRHPRHRGLPEPADGAPLLAAGRGRPGGAHHRHRPRRGQDHDAPRTWRSSSPCRGRASWWSTATCGAPTSTCA